MKHLKIFVLAILFSSAGFAQESEEISEPAGTSSEAIAGSDEPADSIPAKEYVQSTFTSSRLASGQTIEGPAKNELVIFISHRFGSVKNGFYDMFGLDQATTRLGAEYGITDRFSAGFGRSTYYKTFDWYAKYRIIQQATGTGGMPFSLALLSSMSIYSLKWADENEKEAYNFMHRMSFAHQVLIATKLNKTFSFQFMPSFAHKNLVEKESDPSDMFFLGVGGKLRLSRALSFNIEYYYFVNRPGTERFTHPLAIGLNIDTGGHIFQLVFSNSQPWFESGYLTETKGKWLDGDIYFGFHLQRKFSF